MDTGRPTVPPFVRFLDGMLRQVKARAGIPHMPGEDPGVSVTFSLEIQIFGKDSVGQKRKLEVTFDVVKIGWYEMYQDTEIERLYHEFVEKIGPELAHNSEEWACLQCGLPATDIAWISLYTSKIHKRCTILISAGCKTCAIKMQRWTPNIVEVYNRRAGRADDDQSGINTILRPSALSGGFSGACLTCDKDPATAGMSRCGRCKLARSVRIHYDFQSLTIATFADIAGTVNPLARNSHAVQLIHG
ncbi:hypothetical protein MSAN_00605600 [Mycena sanguinolenta]|uniref:Uncharacterized protein n=1 Tax=Mycena sanguinolenta TaxID=230812 RepID=A0A8H7DI13_9AGAR|nr:hypothetical protein MSAN_00605600 [Mycena sanguinolenta]